MSAHADEIRDAEILELQRKVADLERRVTELERRPVFIPFPCPAAQPISPQWPHYQPAHPFRKTWY